jgi:hypothetical protein
MHRIIFAELQNYAETKHGQGTWNQLLNKAGLENNLYLPLKEYPDTEVVALVTAASSMRLADCDGARRLWGIYGFGFDKDVWTPARPRAVIKAQSQVVWGQEGRQGSTLRK